MSDHPYTEHRKIDSLVGKWQSMLNFASWLPYAGFEIVDSTSGMTVSNKQVVSMYFGIDLDRLDDEKRHMLGMSIIGDYPDLKGEQNE